MSDVARLLPDTTASPAQRSRTLVVSFLGGVVHRLGSWLPIGGTVELMTQAGVDAQSVRTAVFRLKQRGWLTSERRDGVRGYALTDTAMTALAAGDEIIWHARPAADLADGWCIVTFSVPESDRGRRHQLRSHLAALGFGNASSGVWIAPARSRVAAERAIDELGLLSRCAIFVGQHVGGEDLRELLASSWDLDRVDAQYRSFIDAQQPLAHRLAGAADPSGQEAFVAYLGLVDGWRRLPYRDPGLPAEVLPASWSAPAAARLFEGLVARLEGPALRHAARHWPPRES